jgi:hypothetical protein
MPKDLEERVEIPGLAGDIEGLLEHVANAKVFDTRSETYIKNSPKLGYDCECYSCQCDGNCDCVCQSNCCDAGPCYGGTG